MNRYEIYCTESQTRRAYLLGAPIENKTKAVYYCNKDYPVQLNVFQYGKIPTTQQMKGWLRKKGLDITAWLESPLQSYKSQLNIWKTVNANGEMRLFNGGVFENNNTYGQAELAAIDAALDYLEKGGNK